ncbi:protein YgfX [Paraglaciecola sp. MB-3u-78]|uniref:protein YgfX n=1 Tax=Paraglaciecola sp. MB-3u-78 TaxID=2058332 RepID=UPI002681D5E6
MSKYRVELKSSRLLVIFKLLVYVILMLSVLNWQSESIQYQLLLQMLTMTVITFCFFKTVFYYRDQKLTPVIFTQGGEWLEVAIDGQISWRMTDKSRVSGLLLFIHLISPLNPRHSKWCLIYKDQVTKRDFRRLCRAVIYQQQTTGID